MIEWADEDVQAARTLHEIYERLAPQFGYTTRGDTQVFDPESPNGRLMIATCKEFLDAALASAQAREAASVPQDEVDAFWAGFNAGTPRTREEATRQGLAALDAHRAKHAKPFAYVIYEGNVTKGILSYTLPSNEDASEYELSVDRLYTHPAPAPQPLSVPTDEQIRYMVSRFLGWPLPISFTPDAGISFDPIYSRGTPYEGRYRPIGTNLLDAEQAEAMVRYLIEGMPEPAPQIPDGWVPVPKEPTEAMHVAAVKTIVRCTGNDDFPPRVWRAMLAADPKPGDDHE